MPTVISITKDASGPVYLRLLEFALERGGLFSLVWRDQFQFDHTAADIQQRLAPLKVEQTKTSRWPGTELIGHKARVITYNLTSKALTVLKEAGSLFSWLQPKLPEDLAFYSNDKRCWLATISHENEAYFVDPSLKVEILQDAIAGLQVKMEQVSPQDFRILKPDREHRPPLAS